MEDDEYNWYLKHIEDEPELPKSPWVDVESSFISAVAYFPLAGVLEIKLKSGNKYTFMDVPQDVYDAFIKAPSKGVFFNKVIRRDYKAS